MLLFVPFMVGGVFGLLGGYLTDLWGRRRVLVLSILLYAFSALAAGFATSVEMLLFLRCTTCIGVCVEFVAAVAWLAELFPAPKQREAVLGFTQAFSSRGRPAGHGGQLPGGPLRRTAAGHPWRARRLALHADLGRDPRDTADRDSPLPARVAAVGREESQRHVAPPQHRPTVCPGTAPHDDRHDADVRLQLRCGVWSTAADAAHRSRSAAGPADDGGQTGARTEEDRAGHGRHR